eukprot:gene603-51996_t
MMPQVVGICGFDDAGGALPPGVPLQRLSEDCLAFLRRCLTVNPAQRAEAAELLAL